jgi:hypothetical protein
MIMEHTYDNGERNLGKKKFREMKQTYDKLRIFYKNDKKEDMNSELFLRETKHLRYIREYRLAFFLSLYMRDFESQW